MTREERIAKELAEIQSRIPRNLLGNVVRESPSSPTIRMVVDKAIADQNFPKEKREKLIVLRDAGEFDKKSYRQDHKIAKMIDDFVEREIRKKIKSGLLPKREDIGDLEHIKRIRKSL